VPRAEIFNGRITVETEYRDKDLIRGIPGSKFDGASRMWSVPLTWAHCLQLRGVFGERLELGPELEAWGYRELNERVAPAMLARDYAMDPESDMPGDQRLYGYQRAGVSFLRLAGSAILGDEMGTGKTVQTIMTLEDADAYPALVVTPKSVKGSWAREYERWAPHRKVIVVTGNAPQRRKLLAEPADVYIIHWEALRLHSRIAGYGNIRLEDKDKEPGELNRPWAAVVADEAHRAKEPKSKQTRALWAIGESAERRYALTGTPIANHPGDFWALLHFVAPDEWPSKTKFIDRYCLTAWNAFGGVDVIGIRPERREEFFRIADPRFLRRSKAIVLRDLPEKVYIRRDVEMTPKQAKAYKELKGDMLARLDSGSLVVTDSLTELTRLAQLASAYLEVDGDQALLSEPSSKLDELEELLSDLGDEPVVVFAASRQLIDLADARLVKRGISHVRVTGSENDTERDWAIRSFQGGHARVILCTLGAGSEGITLTRARNLVFLQRSWSLVQNRQAEDRVHRPGAEEHDSIRIFDLVAPGTVEEGVLDALAAKGDRLEEVTRDDEALRRLLT